MIAVARTPGLTELTGATLILGGARSGKSAFAESLTSQAAAPVYLATAEALDGEMTERVARHRARRGPEWTTVEEPLDLVGAISRAVGPDSPVLVDCLTLWLGNLLGTGRDVERETDRLAEFLRTVAGRVLLVSNEVGHGIVPDNALARRFRDDAGRLHQAVASASGYVFFLVAGCPMVAKAPAHTA